jgi:hypothetical protein
MNCGVSKRLSRCGASHGFLRDKQFDRSFSVKLISRHALTSGIRELWAKKTPSG